MMKLVFALLLCGFSASLANPTCDDSEGNKCSQTDSDVEMYPKTEEDLNKLCSAILPSLDCQLDFIKRCPNTLHGFMSVSMKLYRIYYGKICEEGHPLREMFLAKSHCLEKEVEEAEQRCSDEVTIQNYCLRIDPVQKCINKELNRVCGEDGKELYDKLDKIQRAMKIPFCT